MIVDPCAILRRLSNRGRGYASLTVIALIPLQSTTYLLPLSFFGMKNVGAAMGDLDGHSIPAFSNSCSVSSSACCSASVRRYHLVGFGSLVSHPSMNSIRKFHSFQSFGICFACQSSNTSKKGCSSWGTYGLGSAKVVLSTPYTSAFSCLVGDCSRRTWGSMFRQFS